MEYVRKIKTYKTYYKEFYIAQSDEVRAKIDYVIESLVSTKKSWELFEIIEIQFVISDFGVNGFEFTFAVTIRPLCIKISSFSPT